MKSWGAPWILVLLGGCRTPTPQLPPPDVVAVAPAPSPAEAPQTKPPEPAEPPAAPEPAPVPLLEQPICDAATAGCAEAVQLVEKARAEMAKESYSYGAGGTGAQRAEQALLAAQRLVPLSRPVAFELCRVQLSLGHGEPTLSQLGPLSESERADAEVQAAYGIALLSTGRVKDSLGPLRRARTLEPQRLERALVLGTAELLAEQTEAAERSFRAAVALDSASPEAHGNLGSVLLLLGKTSDARAHLERAVFLAPKRATFVSNLAYAELVGGQLVEAEQRARRATVLDPKLGSAWINLGLVLSKQGKPSEARAAFLKARELDPSDPRVIENLKELDELSGKKP